MLWSLIKFVVFIGVVAALSLGAIYLIETGAGVRIAVADFEFNLGPVQAVIAGLLALLVLWVVLRLLGLLSAIVRFLNGDETAISRWFDRNRERRGYEAMADGLLALASGESRVAMSKAAKAERYLKRPDLTNLLAAQAAEMAGDNAKAEEVYKRLLSDDRTRFVGVRGIMKQKLAAGETDLALKLAEKAFALKPRHEETQDVLLRLQAEQHDWKGARKTLSTKLKHGALPRNVHRRRDAVLALGEAREIVDESKSIEAREAAIEANRLSPDLVPAAVMAARAHIERDQKRYATRILKKAWGASPHPDLATVFAEIEPDETPEARLKRFGALTRQLPDHPETRLLLAELNVAASEFAAARKALGTLPETDPNTRVLALMAAIERGEGAPEDTVRNLLTQALNAPRGPQWVCDNCQTVAGDWEPVCSNCGAFDSLSWREPPRNPSRTGAAIGALPGMVEDRAVAGEDADGKSETDEVGPPDPAAEIPAATVDATNEETETPSSAKS